MLIRRQVRDWLVLPTTVKIGRAPRLRSCCGSAENFARTLAEHALRVVAISGAFVGQLYAQQLPVQPVAGPRLRTAAESCNVMWLRCDAIRPLPVHRRELEASSPWVWNLHDSKTGEQGSKSSSTEGSPKHIFLVVPAFNVTYMKTFKPMTPREKFQEWLQGTYDPRGLGLYAFESATLEHSSRDGFCGYGSGAGGYGKCFGATELDANISSFFGDFLFPVLMHQDPRYFRLGQGSFGKRIGYAISRVFITHADSGRAVFFASALSGTVIGGAASNLYYPAQDRGFRHTVNRIGLDLGNTALFDTAAEFWPDIARTLHQIGHRL